MGTPSRSVVWRVDKTDANGRAVHLGGEGLPVRCRRRRPALLPDHTIRVHLEVGACIRGQGAADRGAPCCGRSLPLNPVRVRVTLVLLVMLIRSTRSSSVIRSRWCRWHRPPRCSMPTGSHRLSSGPSYSRAPRLGAGSGRGGGRWAGQVGSGSPRWCRPTCRNDQIGPGDGQPGGSVSDG